MNPLVSIIIPTFNRSAIIGTTLDSLKLQTFENWECFIIDDGSIDSTEELLDFYTTRDPRIHFFKRPDHIKKGASSCRNIGMEKAKGKYIQFLDSDDIISKEKIEGQVKVMEMDSSISFTTCKWGRFKQSLLDNKIYEGLPSYNDFDDPLEYLNSLSNSLGFFPLHAYLIRSTLIAKAGYWNEYLSINDDAEFMIRILLQTERIEFSNIGYCLYRWPLEENLSSYKNHESALEAIWSWQLIEAYLKIRFKTQEIDFLNKAKQNLLDHIKQYPNIINKHQEFFRNQLQGKDFKSKVIQKLKRFK